MDTWDHPDAETAAAVIGYLAGFGFEEHPEVAIIQQNRRERAKSTLEWVGRWWRAIAENNGLLIAVDNLQWADSASIRLLDYVAQELADVPIMLLSAARPIYRAAHPMYLRDVLAHSLIALEPLTVMATTRVIDAVLSQVERVPDALKQLIIERAEGNPLFVQEFLGMLFDTGVFYQHTSGVWRFNIIQYDSAAAALPHGLMGVLQARLDDLSPEARQIVQIAAIVGQVFWESAVAHLTEMNPHPLLETLVLRGMIMRQDESQFAGETQYTFRHTLYRDVAYEIIPRARREAYHKEIAQWFAPRVVDKPEFYPNLAEQYEAAGQHELALATCLEAVQNRLNRALLTEALILTDRGLGLARNVPREVALPIVSQLWTLRAQTLNALGRYDEASAASQSALMLLREMPAERLPQMRVLASRMLAHSYSSLGRYGDAHEALRQAQQMLPKGDADQEARLLQSFANLSLYQGKLDESLAYLQRGVELGRGTGEYALNGTYVTLGTVLLERGNIGAALGHFERVLANNHARQYRHYVVADLRNIGWLYMCLLAYERALTVLNEAAAIAQSIGLEDYLLQAYRGACYMALGRRTEGLALIMDALRQGEKEAYSERLLFLTYIRALAWAGDMANCREQALVFIQHVRDLHPLLYARGLLWLGVASTALGEKTALAVLQDALRMEQAHGGQCLWWCYSALANATRDPEQRQEYAAHAAQAIQTIGDSLHAHPDLQYAFLHQPFIQGILTQEGETP
jgi:tetratricopeptide (TPR) repeat protein